jgi:hypothetical protein
MPGHSAMLVTIFCAGFRYKYPGLGGLHNATV